MAEIKLQFSVVCEWSDGKNIGNIYPGFIPGEVEQFHIVNKWVWDEEGEGEADSGLTEDCYQQTGIVEINEEGNEQVIALSRSDKFRVKNSHTHNNRFTEIKFRSNFNYRIRVELFCGKKGSIVETASMEYPLLVR